MAGGVITRSAHPDALWPGVKDWFGLTYGQLEPQWSKLFQKMDSDKFQEYIIEATTFGLAPVKAEEVLQDRGGSLSNKDVYNLTLLATGDKEQAEDARSRRIMDELRRGLVPDV